MPSSWTIECSCFDDVSLQFLFLQEGILRSKAPLMLFLRFCCHKPCRLKREKNQSVEWRKSKWTTSCPSRIATTTPHHTFFFCLMVCSSARFPFFLSQQSLWLKMWSQCGGIWMYGFQLCMPISWSCDSIELVDMMSCFWFCWRCICKHSWSKFYFSISTFGLAWMPQISMLWTRQWGRFAIDR